MFLNIINYTYSSRLLFFSKIRQLKSLFMYSIVKNVICVHTKYDNRTILWRILYSLQIKIYDVSSANKSVLGLSPKMDIHIIIPPTPIDARYTYFLQIDIVLHKILYTLTQEPRIGSEFSSYE